MSNEFLHSKFLSLTEIVGSHNIKDPFLIANASIEIT